MPPSSFSGKNRDVEALAFFESYSADLASRKRPNPPLGSSHNPIVRDSPPRPLTPTPARKHPLDQLDNNTPSPRVSKVARVVGALPLRATSPSPLPVAHTKKAAKAQPPRVPSPPSPPRGTASFTIAAAAGPSTSSVASSDPYWSTERITETLDRGELMRMFRVLDAARVALYGDRKNDMQVEATKLLGHHQLTELFITGMVSKKAFDDIRRTGTISAEAVRDIAMVDMEGDRTAVGIYEDLGKRGDTTSDGRRKGRYLGSGLGRSKGRKTYVEYPPGSGVRVQVSGVLMRVFAEHENPAYRAKNTSVHYTLFYDNSDLPHDFMFWWKMARLAFEATLMRFFPEDDKFNALRVATGHILEAAFMQLTGAYRHETIERIKRNEAVLCVDRGYRSANCASALAEGGDLITSETSGEKRAAWVAMIPTRMGRPEEEGLTNWEYCMDKWQKEGYSGQPYSGDRSVTGKVTFERYKTLSLAEWLNGAKSKRVSIQGHITSLEFTTASSTIQWLNDLDPLKLGWTIPKSLILALPYGAHKYLSAKTTYHWRLHASVDWSPASMRIDVSLDGQQIYSFGAAEYQNAAALRARDGVRKEKEAVPSPFQRWALVCHVFKHWSEGANGEQ